MKSVAIENTDIMVSRLGFGTASLHHLFNSRERQALLQAAADSGISHFDTSPYYGYGLAEQDLGRFLKRRRQAFTLTTKIGLYPWGRPSRTVAGVWGRIALGKLVSRVSLPVASWAINHAQASLGASLKRLGTDYVDFLLLHEPIASLINTDEFLTWLQAEQTRGRIRAWGLAGLAEHLRPFVQQANPLATVVQTKDSLSQQQAAFMADAQRNLQFTYGYLSSASTQGTLIDPRAILKQALVRNQTGALLVSTRRVNHLQSLAEVAH